MNASHTVPRPQPPNGCHRTAIVYTRLNCSQYETIVGNIGARGCGPSGSMQQMAFTRRRPPRASLAQPRGAAGCMSRAGACMPGAGVFFLLLLLLHSGVRVYAAAAAAPVRRRTEVVMSPKMALRKDMRARHWPSLSCVHQPAPVPQCWHSSCSQRLAGSITREE